MGVIVSYGVNYCYITLILFVMATAGSAATQVLLKNVGRDTKLGQIASERVTKDASNS